MFAVSGVQRAFEAVQAEREEHKPGTAAAGCGGERVRPRSPEHQFRIDELRDIFGPLVMPVRCRTGWPCSRRRARACHPHVEHAWRREVALAFNLLLARVLRASRRRTRSVFAQAEEEAFEADETVEDEDSVEEAVVEEAARSLTRVPSAGRSSWNRTCPDARGRHGFPHAHRLHDALAGKCWRAGRSAIHHCPPWT